VISLRMASQTRIALIRPGATNFDQQGRMKGSLDMPLCDQGHSQAEALAEELSSLSFDAIYTGPCQSAMQTAARLAEGRGLKPKVIDALRNVDHGLWHGKLIDEIRRTQPRLYRTFAEKPGVACPPGGERVAAAWPRIEKAVRRILRRNRNQFIAVVIPDPLASVVASELKGEPLPDIWKVETDAGHWQLIETPA